MNHGIRDREFRARRQAATAGRSSAPASDVLAQYPSYLTPAAPRREPAYAPLLSSVLAYVVAWVAQFAASYSIATLFLVRMFPGFGASDEEIQHAALLAAVSVIGSLTLVGIVAAAVVLRLRRAPRALLAAVLGEVADLVVSTAGGRVSGTVGLVLGALAGVATIYVLITRRRAG